MITWQELINHVYLFQTHKSWCPLCYEEFRHQKHIYEPLLWFLKPVAICLHHYHPLITQCPFCNQKISIISAESRPGYCNNCGQWLGSSKHINLIESVFEQKEINLQEELIKIFGELITYTPEASLNPQKRFYKQIIAYFQLRELENAEASKPEIFTRRVSEAMNYNGHTVKDFWKEFSLSTLETISNYRC